MSGISDRLLNASIVVVGVCALLTTSMAVLRTLHPVANGTVAATVAVPDWRRLALGAHRRGSALAPVTIIEFSDFQCPYCREAADVLKAVMAKYPGSVALVYRHLPLQNLHPLARAAAIAAECAADQGQFWRYHDALFDADSLSLAALSRSAVKAGVADRERFVACRASAATAAIVDRDVRAARGLGLQATPAILVNEHLVIGGAQSAVIDSLVAAELSSRERNTQ